MAKTLSYSDKTAIVFEIYRWGAIHKLPPGAIKERIDNSFGVRIPIATIKQMMQEMQTKNNGQLTAIKNFCLDFKNA
jgi:hypothetical protein